MKGILFDFDGVIADTMQDLFLAWKASMESYGKTIMPCEYFPYEGLSATDVALMFCKNHHLPTSAAPDLVKKKEEHYRRNHHFRCYPGVVELIDTLASKGVPIGIVTAGSSQKLSHSVPPSLLSKFSSVITADRYERGKPAPDPYLKGMEELHLTPGECVVVENAPLGITAAKAAGCHCIAIASTLDRAALQRADRVIGSFQELREQDVIARMVEG